MYIILERFFASKLGGTGSHIISKKIIQYNKLQT